MSEQPTYEALIQRVRELEERVSDYARLTASLEENEAFMKDVLKASSVGISYTRDRKILWANDAMEELFGFQDAEEYRGMDTAELFARKDDYARVGKMLYEQQREEKIVYYDTTFVRKDGTRFDGLVRVNLFDVDDVNKGVIVSVIDITPRKRAEQALRQSEEKYRILVENSNDAIFVAQEGMIKFANRRTAEMLGIEDDDVYAVPFLEFLHPDDRDIVVDRHIRRLRGETDLPATYSFSIVRQDGVERLVQLNTVLFDWQGKPATLNFVRDITEQRLLEDSLKQAQKMEALGTLAGGIAHDFNNLLMGIQGRASLLSLELGAAGPHTEHTKAIEEYVQSATTLTKQLLGLARGGKYDVRPVNLSDLVRSTAAMFGRTHKEIRIHAKTSDSPLVAEVDRRQIEQLLLNLFINAWQAMPDGGDIYLETSEVHLDDTARTSHQVKPGPYCRISITDTGIGMDENVMQRIFDPFFTTKEKGRGTGLGLASAFGITKNHGGMIAVSSEVGHGSTFDIYLPKSDLTATDDRKMESGLMRGTETILLVDDEKMVIDVGKELLGKLGYEVLTAIGGPEALAVIEQRDHPVDLVILDMIMPGIGGGKTFDRIREVRPGLPVILSSGYSLDGEASEIMSRGCNGFIQKPFKIEDLSRKIREIIDGGGSSRET